MKTLLALIFIAACAATASAQSYSAQSEPVRAIQRRPAEVAQPPVATGALPRATRGNPLQMVNPSAAAKYYGPPEETVMPAPYTSTAFQRQREQPEYSGVILLGWRW